MQWYYNNENSYADDNNNDDDQSFQHIYQFYITIPQGLLL